MQKYVSKEVGEERSGNIMRTSEEGDIEFIVVSLEVVGTTSFIFFRKQENRRVFTSDGEEVIYERLYDRTGKFES